MTLVTQIVLTVIIACAAFALILVASILNESQIAWPGFLLALVAHASYLDVRTRWRIAYQPPRPGADLSSLN